MTEPPPTTWSGRGYLLFAAVVVSVVGALAGIGALVASLRQDGSLPAVLAALGSVGLASLLSGVVVSFSGGPPASMLNRALLAMLVRLVLVAGLAAVCVLVLEVPRGPFLIWLVTAYLVLLAVDTVFSVRAAKGR